MSGSTNGVQGIYQELSAAVESGQPENICSQRPVEKFCKLAISVAASGKMTEQQFEAVQTLATKIDQNLNIVAQNNASLRSENELFPQTLSDVTQLNREISKELNEAKSSLNQKENELAFLQEDKKKLEEKIASKEKLIEEKDQIISTTKNTETTVQSGLRSAKTKLKRAEGELKELRSLLSEKDKEINQTKAEIHKLTETQEENKTLQGRVHSLVEDVGNRNFLLRLKEDRIKLLEELNTKLKTALLVGSAKFEDQNEQGLQIMKILTQSQVYSNLQISDLQNEICALENEIHRLNHLLEAKSSSRTVLPLEFQGNSENALFWDSMAQLQQRKENETASELIKEKEMLESALFKERQIVKEKDSLCSQLEQQIETLHKEAVSSQEEQHTKNQQITQLKQQLAEVQKEKETATSGCRAVLAKLRKVRAESATTIGNLTKEKEAVESESRMLFTKLSEFVGKFNHQEEKLTTLDQALIEKTNEIARNKEEIRTLKREAEVSRKRMGVIIRAGGPQPTTPIRMMDSRIILSARANDENLVEPSIGRWQAGFDFMTRHPLLTAVTIAGVAASIGLFVASSYSSEDNAASIEEYPDLYTILPGTQYLSGTENL